MNTFFHTLTNLFNESKGLRSNKVYACILFFFIVRIVKISTTIKMNIIVFNGGNGGSMN